jgi:septum formation protein
MKKIILASTSIYRKELLKKIGITFSCVNPEVDESAYKNKLYQPKEIAEKLSCLKTNTVLELNPEAIVIGSDQVIHLNGETFSKPKSIENAISQLKKMRGKTHELISGVTISTKEKSITFSHSTFLTLREDLLDSEIEYYVNKEEPLFCAGSYMIENLGIALFSEIRTTDFNSIIGLPLIDLITHLKKFNIHPLRQ